MSVVHQAIQDRVGVSRVRYHMMPTGYGKLAGDDGRTTAVAFLEDLEQIVARERIERFQAPVVENQQLVSTPTEDSPEVPM